MIKSMLEQEGYFIHQWNSQSCLVEALQSYGNICLQTEVKIDPQKTSLIYSNKEMDFHNDEFSVDWIAWFCNYSGLEDEFTYVIPKSELQTKINQLDQDVLDVLSKTFCKTYESAPENNFEVPILQIPNLYFVPWMLKESNWATEKLKEILAQCTYEKIRLQPNQALIISNKFCLHGRSALNPHSPRHLTRYWVQLHE